MTCFAGLKRGQIMPMWAQEFLSISKTNRQLSKPYDISTNQIETDDNVSNS
jgi:hypothetical protein